MKKITPVPHDALFKTFLTHPDTARDFLDIHLPEAFRRECDLSTLTLTSGSFIEEDLRSYCSDVLYSLRTTSGDGYVYCLIEHQSSPDKHMAFRLLRYAVAAMQRHLADGSDELPLVIPLLFYHGQVSPYPYTLCWLDLFSDRALAEKLYTHDFPLADVTVIPDDAIMQHRRVAILELIQKHIRIRDLAGLTDRLVTLLQAGYTEESQLVSLMHYVLQAGNSADGESFIRNLAQRVPEHGDALMTIAEQLEQKGMEKGMQIGEQRGLEKGKQEGRLEVARTMLQNGLDRGTVMKMTGLTEDELTQIRH
jgi:recombination-promoting nuclease RpnB